MIEVDEKSYLAAIDHISSHFRCFRQQAGRDEVWVSLVWGKPVAAACNNRTHFLVCEKVFPHLHL